MHPYVPIRGRLVPALEVKVSRGAFPTLPKPLPMPPRPADTDPHAARYTAIAGILRTAIACIEPQPGGCKFRYPTTAQHQIATAMELLSGIISEKSPE